MVHELFQRQQKKKKHEVFIFLTWITCNHGVSSLFWIEFEIMIYVQ